MNIPPQPQTAEGLPTVVEGEGPLVAVAIHHGHQLRPEVEAIMALSEDARLREEDPFTGAWAEIAPTRLVVNRSRFEVDLNRPRERAVYRHPADAWGLRIWKETPTEAFVDRSLRLYDAFYAQAKRTLDRVAEREELFVVLDLHSYNHRRAGPEAFFDAQSKHPDINIGTGSMQRGRWRAVVEAAIAELSRCEHLGRKLDVRENVKFYGGAFSRWVHDNYPNVGCAIAIELKKFFMDEWTGQLYPDIHHGILETLRTTARVVVDELVNVRMVRSYHVDTTRDAAVTSRINSDARKQSPPLPIDYGELATAIWRCTSCSFEVFPIQLDEAKARPPFRCGRCGEKLRCSRLPRTCK